MNIFPVRLSRYYLGFPLVHEIPGRFTTSKVRAGTKAYAERTEPHLVPVVRSFTLIGWLSMWPSLDG